MLLLVVVLEPSLLGGELWHRDPLHLSSQSRPAMGTGCCTAPPEPSHHPSHLVVVPLLSFFACCLLRGFFLGLPALPTMQGEMVARVPFCFTEAESKKRRQCLSTGALGPKTSFWCRRVASCTSTACPHSTTRSNRNYPASTTFTSPEAMARWAQGR